VTSIFQAALGDDFARLHPKLQWRFGFASGDGVCQLGSGVMHEVWRGPWWTLPFLLLGSTRRVLFPSRGREVPFVIANYAYVDLHCSVDDDGALRMRSGEQRFHEGRVGFRFPMLVSGVADVREWWDEPTQRFHIDVDVRNPYLGRLFGYRGSFSVTELPCQPGDVPVDVRPIREERRE
jgi:hypothetical protein